MSILHKDSTSEGIYSSPPGKLNIFTVGSQSSHNRYSKALHGANETVIRTRPKNYRDKAHLADGDVLRSSPGSLEAGDMRSSQRQ